MTAKRESETVGGYASIQQTQTGKLVLRVSIHPEDMRRFLLENGKQPEGLIDSILFIENKMIPNNRRFSWWKE